MNNGNLLSSLLGATGASSAAAKSTAPKNRADTTEKFQQAFEQARPEVAARKPVPRKEPERQTTEPRPAGAKSDSRPEPVSRTTDPKKVAKTADSRDQTVRDPSAQESPLKSEVSSQEAVADDTVADEQSAATRDTDSVEQHESDTESEEAVMFDAAALLELSEPPLEDSETVITLPIGVVPVIQSDVAQSDTVQSDELISTEDIASPLLAETGLDEGDAALTLEEDVIAVAVPESAVVTSVPVTPLPGVETAEDLAAIGVDIRTVGLNSLNASVSIQPNGNQSAVSAGLSLVDDTLSASTSEGAPTETLVLVEGENSEVPDLTDNPDFALLNTKAGFNKMVEANFTSLDKAATTTELAKPVAAAVSALESITRPLESQSPAARAFVVQTGVPVTVGSPQWSQAVGDKVLWLAAQNVSAAEIRLDPPELGPMQVKVSVTQDQASVTFTSHNPVVRDALDQQLNRLREMFSEQGLNLVNVDVSDKSFAQQQRDQEESGKSRASVDVEEEELMPVAMTQVASVRLVDHYA